MNDNKKRGLGRGLGALLASTDISFSSEEIKPAVNADKPTAEGRLHFLPIEWLEPNPYQPRREFKPELLEELAASIKQHGVLQPIVVRKVGEEKYQIIAGERRWRACQLAGLSEIPALIKTSSNQDATSLALIENIQREDLNVIEEARALARLVDEFSMTHQQVAEAIGKSRTAVTNTLRLMGLNEEVKTLLASHDIEMGHARALLALPREQQLEAARIIISNGLSVRQTEALVKKLLSNETVTPAETKIDPNIRHLEQALAQKLGAQVTIRHSDKGKGSLTIQYHSLDELEGVLAHLGLNTGESHFFP